MKKREVRLIILEEAIEAARQGYPPDAEEIMDLLKTAGRRVVADQDDTKNNRLARLEKMASARFLIFTEDGVAVRNTSLEFLWVNANTVGGAVLNMNGFTGKIVVKPQ